MAKQEVNKNLGQLKEGETTGTIKPVTLTKEDLVKEHENLMKSYNEVNIKLNEMSGAKLKLEGAIINLQELIKKFE